MTIASVTSIVTAHREAAFLPVALRSAEAAIARAQTAHPHVAHARLIVLDRPDEATRAAARALPSWKIHEIDGGDPALARFAGVKSAKTSHFAFLDGDDLWGEDWLAQGITMQGRVSPEVFLHAEYNLIFGRENALVRQGVDPELGYLPDYQRIANFWDAMCFGRVATYRAYPMERNSSDLGFAHEDQDWVLRTLSAGIGHMTVPGSIHFKRRRSVSISVNAVRAGARVRPGPATLWRSADAQPRPTET